MPWCDDCSKFWNPNSLTVDGKCPTCGRTLGAAATRRTTEPAGDAAGDVTGGDPTKVDLRQLAGEEGRAPWHFKLLVVALVLYLGWRGWQGIDWLLHR